MSKKLAFFKPIDEFLFSKVEQFKNSNVYREINERLLTLSETQRKYLNQTVTISILMIPMFLVSFIFFQNYQLKNSLQEKEKIQELLNNISDYSGKVNLLTRTTISNRAVNSKSDLQNRIRSILSMGQIPSTRVKLTKFRSDSSLTTMNKANAEITFEEFSLTNLKNLLLQLQRKEKVKISNLQIKKDEEKNTLKGKLHIIHFGKK